MQAASSKGGHASTLILSVRISVSALCITHHWDSQLRPSTRAADCSSACHSQGSRAMKCAPRAGCALVGFGVAISLFLAILVLALANSSLRVCGFSGSKRMPYIRRKKKGTT